MPFRRAPNCATGPTFLRRTNLHRNTLTGPELRVGGRPLDTDLVGPGLSRPAGNVGDVPVLRRGCRLTTMGEREPVGQVLGGLGRGETIKGHHRRRNARRAHELGPPSIADGHDLNGVRAPADSLFETMSNHSDLGWTNGTADLTPHAERIKRSATRRGVHTSPEGRRLRRLAARKYLSWRVLNRFSTGHPQVFHSVRDSPLLHAAESTIGGLSACA